MKQGAWSIYQPLTKEDFMVFCEAIQGVCGTRYEPVLVSKQIVNGTNYHFICNALSEACPQTNYIAKISVFRPLYDPCECQPIRITDICELRCRK